MVSNFFGGNHPGRTVSGDQAGLCPCSVSALLSQWFCPHSPLLIPCNATDIWSSHCSQDFCGHPLVEGSHKQVSSTLASPEFSSCYLPCAARSQPPHLKETPSSLHPSTCFPSGLPHLSTWYHHPPSHPSQKSETLSILSLVTHCILLTLPSTYFSDQFGISLHLPLLSWLPLTCTTAVAQCLFCSILPSCQSIPHTAARVLLPEQT